MRVQWSELPQPLRHHVELRVGAAVQRVEACRGGFSLGVLGVATLADGGQVFIKAVPDTADNVADFRAEAAVARFLPAALPTPRMRFWVELAGWVLLCFDVAPGALPHEPWLRHELDAALEAVALCAKQLTPSPAGGLPTVGARMAGRCDTWRGLARTGVHGPVRDADLGAWERAHLRRLEAIEERWPDLVCLLLQSDLGSLDPEELFNAHPVGRGADPALVDAFLVALAGYWTHTAALPGPVRGRREYSRAATIGWLRRRWS